MKRNIEDNIKLHNFCFLKIQDKSDDKTNHKKKKLLEWSCKIIDCCLMSLNGLNHSEKLLGNCDQI